MNTLVIVDVQPAYENYIDFDINNMFKYISHFDNILWLYNGESVGYDDDLEYWLDSEYDFYETDNITFFKKEYGYFRNLIDAHIDEEIITKIGKYMLDHDFYDSRDLSDKDFEKLDLDDKVIEILQFDGIWFNNSLIEELKDLNSITLIGGGQDECLKEIEIYCNILNINYSLNTKFIY